MGVTEYRDSIERMLDDIDITETEKAALRANIAELHDEIESIIFASDLSPEDLSFLLEELDQAVDRQMSLVAAQQQDARLLVWMSAAERFEEQIASFEIRWKLGTTGLESEVISSFLTTSRIVEVTEEMKAAIKAQVLSAALLETSSFSAMVAISNIIGIRDKPGFRELGATGITAKGERILRTELMTVMNSSKHVAFNNALVDFPDLLKVWLATGDIRTRDTHLDAHGQLRAVNEPFVVGGALGMFPLDPNLPIRERANCRCTDVPYRATWGELETILGPLSKSNIGILVEEDRIRREKWLLKKKRGKK